MGTDTLVDHVDGQIIDADDINIIHRVLEVDFVGRNASGAPTAGQRLGTPLIPWGTGYFNGLVIGGVPVEPGLITALPNRILSGKVRLTSDFPDYLRPAGSSASFTLLATATDLEIDVNSVLATFTADVVKSGLTTAPGVADLCAVNDSALTGQDWTKNLGENKTVIPVNLMQANLTAKIGEFVALLNQATNEILYCHVDSATQLSNARRGFFLDSSGNPIARDVLNNGDLLQLLSLAFIFADKDGVTVDVSYRNPVIGADTPASPATGDYWLDTNVNVWKRYSGSAFVQIDRTFAGFAVVDTLNCIGTRPEDFSKAYRKDNSLAVKRESVDIIVSVQDEFLVSVNAEEQKYDFGFMRWDASTDFESGVTRTKDRHYWLYLTEDGEPVISDKKPYDRLGFYQAWQHPYESWRCVAQIYNNTAGASGEFSVVHSTDENLLNYRGNPVVSLTNRVILSNGVAVDTIDNSAGRIILDDESAEYTAPALTKDLTANWTQGTGGGGSPGLTLTANTTYHYFAITNDDGSLIDFGMDTSLTAANLLAYAPVIAAQLTKPSYQGSLVTDGSANIILFVQHDRWFWWNPRILTIGPLNAIALPVGPTLRTMTVPAGIKVLAKINPSVDSGGGLTSLREGIFSDPDMTAYAPAAGIGNFMQSAGGGQGHELDIMTNISGQIREQWFGGGVAGTYHILTAGYKNLRLKT
jgi:hypothetical protein